MRFCNIYVYYYAGNRVRIKDNENYTSLISSKDFSIQEKKKDLFCHFKNCQKKRCFNSRLGRDDIWKVRIWHIMYTDTESKRGRFFLPIGFKRVSLQARQNVKWDFFKDFFLFETYKSWANM